MSEASIFELSSYARDLASGRTIHFLSRRFAAAFAGCLVLSLMVGCATGSGLTRQELIEQVDSAGQLAAALSRADEAEIDVLAPAGYDAASATLDEAIDAAAGGNATEAAKLANKGLARLEKAERDSSRAAGALREVLETRERAVAAGAPTLLGERFEALEKDLREAASLAEGGDLSEAKEAEPGLLKRYSSIELEALKTDAADLARAAIEEAREGDAERYAPDTFANAEKELGTALRILETDRSRIDQANVHARRAAELATRSEHISELVQEFDRRDYTREEVVTWYQAQIEDMTKPLETEISFSQPNHEVVATARAKIAEAIAGRQAAEDGLEAAEERIASLERSASESTASLQARIESSERAQRAAEARYERVDSLFNENEAVVYRRGKNVLLETYGFDFPVGQSEIRSTNFPLLNKISGAIGEFDAPKVIVTGHTDATGSTETNEKLSRERAQKIAEFLVEVGGLAGDRVVAEGMGESKPVASNETEDGRAKNRRIEILIVNQ